MKILKSPSTLAWIFICLHILVWTLTNTFDRYTPNGDVVEALNWGQHFAAGYDKNPYLPGWMGGISRYFLVFYGRFFGYYLLQQLWIGSGLLGWFYLGKSLFGEKKALISILILEGCLYVTAYAQTNNDNYLLIGLIPWIFFFFYRLVESQESPFILGGIALGTLSGLAFMTKYSAGIFFLAMFLYGLNPPKIKRLWHQKIGILVGLIALLILCFPNLIWLKNHEWITLRYLSARSQAFPEPWIDSHLWGPLNFLWMSFCNIILSLLLFLSARPYRFSAPSNSKNFLLFMAFVPLIFVLLYWEFTGTRAYWEWGVPFVIPFLWVLSTLFEFKTSPQTLWKITIGLMLFGSGLTFSINFWIHPGGSADFPAQEIAKESERLWHQRAGHLPFLYVGGSRYLAGYVSLYAPEHPQTYNEWNPLYSPGITDEMIRKHGALFVSNGDFGTTVTPLGPEYTQTQDFPKTLYQRFPHLVLLEKKSFKYHGKSPVFTTVLWGWVKPNS